MVPNSRGPRGRLGGAESHASMARRWREPEINEATMMGPNETQVTTRRADARPKKACYRRGRLNARLGHTLLTCAQAWHDQIEPPNCYAWKLWR